MANTVPYIGSKISLISNSEIRYEGILYTINTQESTIALQSVKTFGTEGRKMPEIPPSSEIYDFIIFRGQDIKDLTVLEGAQNQSSAMLSDPAIMSMNQRPSGGKGKDNPKGGGKAENWKGGEKGKDSYDRYDRGDSGKGWNQSSWNQPSWGGGGKGDGWGKGGGKWNDGGKGRADAYSGGGGGYGGGGKGKDYYAMDKGKAAKGGGKGGKYDSKGFASKGKGKGDGGKGGSYTKGRDAGKGDNRRSGKGGGKHGMTAAGVPVGELLPEMNDAAKKAYAEDFDVTAANTKFEKVTDSTEKQPLSGYNKTSSFFDNISCEATDRAGDTDRPKIDREKARQFDKDTFGDTRRPPRPVGVRRGKGKGKGN